MSRRCSRCSEPLEAHGKTLKGSLPDCPVRQLSDTERDDRGLSDSYPPVFVIVRDQ